MEWIRRSGGGDLAIASPREVNEVLDQSATKGIVCLISAGCDSEGAALSAIHSLLERGCDYFALHGPRARVIEDQVDSLIESQAPTPIAGADELPAHATTSILEGESEDVAASFLHSIGSQSVTRSATIWLAIIGPDAPDPDGLRDALVTLASCS